MKNVASKPSKNKVTNQGRYIFGAKGGETDRMGSTAVLGKGAPRTPMKVAGQDINSMLL